MCLTLHSQLLTVSDVGYEDSQAPHSITFDGWHLSGLLLWGVPLQHSEDLVGSIHTVQNVLSIADIMSQVLQTQHPKYGRYNVLSTVDTMSMSHCKRYLVTVTSPMDCVNLFSHSVRHHFLAHLIVSWLKPLSNTRSRKHKQSVVHWAEATLVIQLLSLTVLPAHTAHPMTACIHFSKQELSQSEWPHQLLQLCLLPTCTWIKLLVYRACFHAMHESSDTGVMTQESSDTAKKITPDFLPVVPVVFVFFYQWLGKYLHIHSGLVCISIFTVTWCVSPYSHATICQHAEPIFVHVSTRIPCDHGGWPCVMYTAIGPSVQSPIIFLRTVSWSNMSQWQGTNEQNMASNAVHTTVGFAL